MKTQMRFQKYICLTMLIVGALALVYSFCYSTGGLATLTERLDTNGFSMFTAREGFNDATLFYDIQGFNDTLMYCGIVMILLAAGLYITGCHKRRNYYITNFIAIGACAGGNIVISVILMVMNGMWLGEFKNIDFEAWLQYNKDQSAGYKNPSPKLLIFSDSTAWFMVGFVVYAIVIIASTMLILNLVWKIKLMQGERRLLNGQTVGGGAV